MTMLIIFILCEKFALRKFIFTNAINFSSDNYIITLFYFYTSFSKIYLFISIFRIY